MIRNAAGLALVAAFAASAASQPKIILIAGAKSHGPGFHEYLKSAKLLKVLLDRAKIPGLITEVHFNGWPEDARTLETASAIWIMSDGQPSVRQIPMPLFTPERTAVLRRLMGRGCGVGLIHYSTFVTKEFMPEALDWVGGYFEWSGPDGYISKIKTIETPLVFPNPGHPVLRGLKPFTFKDEYYYRMKLKLDAPGYTPILQVPVLEGTPAEHTVAWAIARPDGGRGFGTTTGHFYTSWTDDSYRRYMLNAILWTARVEVPAGGINSAYADDAEVNRALRTGRQHPVRIAIDDSARARAVIEALDSELPVFEAQTGAVKPRDRLVIADRMTPELERYLSAGGSVILLPAGKAAPAIRKVDPKQHELTRHMYRYDSLADAAPVPVESGAIVLAVIGDAPVATLRSVGKGRLLTTTLAATPEAIQLGTSQLIRDAALSLLRR